MTVTRKSVGCNHPWQRADGTPGPCPECLEREVEHLQDLIYYAVRVMAANKYIMLPADNASIAGLQAAANLVSKRAAEAARKAGGPESALDTGVSPGVS